MITSVRAEENGYRVEGTPTGITITAIGRSYNQYDDREYQRCLYIPLDELQPLRDLLSRLHDLGVIAGFWKNS